MYEKEFENLLKIFLSFEGSLEVFFLKGGLVKFLWDFPCRRIIWKLGYMGYNTLW